MTSYVDMLNQERQKEENIILNILKGCSIATIKYDLITLELPVYIEFEPTFHNIRGYEFLKFIIPHPKPPKKREKESTRPRPVTHYRVNYYRNIRTGNIVELSESSKKLFDSSGTQYYSLRAKFRSENSNVTINDIKLFILPILKQYFLLVEEQKIIQNSHWVKQRLPQGFLYHHPFTVFYSEPCIDIKGPKEKIDFLHQNFIENLYVSRFTRRREEKGKKSGKFSRHDGRILDRDLPTKYVSRRVRLYRYTRNGEHLRFEFRFDKQFMGYKEIKDIDSYSESFNPSSVWNKKCKFFMFNLPQIETIVRKKAPEQLNKIMSFILEKQYADEGKEMSNWDKFQFLKKYEINGTKLFRDSSKLIVPKWLSLHKFMSDALSQLSLVKQPSMDIKVVPEKIEQISQRGRAIDNKITNAVIALLEKGIPVTQRSVMKESGINSSRTIARRSALLREIQDLYI
ncbi:MAG: hypothetical protein HZA17_03595 [Nitrospirae bacterium]|nr:hypothetical protein [Nitrospirota bacterium]